MFELIQPSDLIKNKKYKIVSSKTEFIGIYIGTKYIEQYDYVNVYEVFDILTKKNIKWRTEFSPNCSIYTMVPRAQEQMERRALNMIVRGILGDECFTW